MVVRNRLAAVCALAGLLVAGAHAATFSQLVVFGDSLSDAGNAAAITSGNFPPSPFPYAGQFSNGRTAAEYLAQGYGVTVQLGWPAPSSGSNNFAVGGGLNGSGNYNVQIGNPPGLGLAYPQMADTGIAQQIVLFQSQHATVAEPASTLFLVWGGPNDMYLGFETGRDMSLVIPGAINDLALDIGILADMGAKHILVPGMPDLGKTPEGLALDPAVAQALSDVSAFYNAGLDATLDGLRIVYPNVNLYGYDTGAFFTDLASRPGSGFTNTTQGCFNPRADPLDFSIVLAGCPGYLYFDNVHPTTAAHALLAAQFAQAVPEPETYGLMLLGLMVIGLFVRQQRQS